MYTVYSYLLLNTKIHIHNKHVGISGFPEELGPQSTQPCIPLRLLNQVPASAGGKGGILISPGWQVTLYDHMWHVSFPLQ